MQILTERELEKAIACNEYYSKIASAPFPPEPFTGLEPTSPEFASAVARWQRNHALYIDGILGVKTRAALEGLEWQAPKGENYVIVGGEKVPTKFPVVHWTHPDGISFPRVMEALPDWTGVWHRPDPSKPIERFVLHWDNAASSHDCFHILLWRNLSVQFCLDGDGTLYQTMDLRQMIGRHARWTNDSSVGIEINNPQYLTAAWGVANRAIVRASQPHTADTTWRHLDYTPRQKETISWAIPAICDILHIPRKLPQDDCGEVPKGLIPNPQSFQGVLGHYHLQTDKEDPGYTLWPVLLKAL